MRPPEFFAAIGYSSDAEVGTRIPKTVLLERTTFSAPDRRLLSDGIEILRWEATLKPETVGIAPFNDEDTEYLEIAVISAEFRKSSRVHRLRELIHRAIPYPVVLVAQVGEEFVLSLAQKRRSQSEADAFVLDGEAVEVVLEPVLPEFLEAFALASQPRSDLRALYQGWIETAEALQAARRTGGFTLPRSPKHAERRRDALRECARIEEEMRQVERRAAKARLLREKSDLNHMMGALRAEYHAAEAHL